MSNKIILFTGGGSAGHATPNLALIQQFQAHGWQAIYIGSVQGIEREIIAPAGIAYYGIASGKLRRYFSWQNFIDPCKVAWGFFQAFFLCRKLKPRIIFSKGGFVAFPVVVAAWLNRIPVIIHESDLLPGLANRLSFPFAKTICLTFAESKKYFKNTKKLLVTGTPLRAELFTADANKGREFCHFSTAKKIIFIFGGGLGAQSINDAVRALLPKLLIDYQVIHVCGKGKLNAESRGLPGYLQFEYLHAELPHVLACADLVISRAGANSLYELLALRKPHILIPLSKAASRGDQIANADYFSRLGLSQVIAEEALTAENLLAKIIWLEQHGAEVTQALQQFVIPDSAQMIYQQALTL